MVKLKYEPETNAKNLKGPCVVVIHAEWCGHCKDFMPVYNNEIVLHLYLLSLVYQVAYIEYRYLPLNFNLVKPNSLLWGNSLNT